jgi:hypothetical protein
VKRKEGIYHRNKGCGALSSILHSLYCRLLNESCDINLQIAVYMRSPGEYDLPRGARSKATPLTKVEKQPSSSGLREQHVGRQKWRKSLQSENQRCQTEYFSRNFHRHVSISVLFSPTPATIRRPYPASKLPIVPSQIAATESSFLVRFLLGTVLLSPLDLAKNKVHLVRDRTTQRASCPDEKKKKNPRNEKHSRCEQAQTHDSYHTRDSKSYIRCRCHRMN